MKNKPDALLCADLHLRSNNPLCRIDDYQYAQNNKLLFIADLAREYNIPIIDSGDTFHKAFSRKSLEITFINIFNQVSIYAICGNHDLVGHSYDNFNDSSIGVVFNALPYMQMKRESKVEEFKYSMSLKLKGKRIGVIHEYIHAPKIKNHKIEGYSTDQIFDKMFDYDLILTGDNHITFTKQRGNQLLVNPGSMMRMNADQINHKPCVFLWYAEDNRVEQVFLPIEDNVIDVSHIDIEKEKLDRTNAFIERMNNDYELSLSFQKNMKQHLKVNKTRSAVENIIWECIDGHSVSTSL